MLNKKILALAVSSVFKGSAYPVEPIIKAENNQNRAVLKIKPVKYSHIEYNYKRDRKC